MKRFAVILALLASPGLASAEELLTVKGAATVKECQCRLHPPQIGRLKIPQFGAVAHL